ncbi:MAG: DUF177 domain-containing protein [Deltaproteobacteria bacterium]|nr:DUF177 domain-containing protein [Deltaproteobacteria bacterium]
MKVKTEDINTDGLCLDIVEDLRKFDTASDDSRIIRCLSPVNASIHIRRFGSEIYIDGFIDVDVILKCVRCLDEFECRIHSVLNRVFLKDSKERQKDGEQELSKEELDVNYYSGDELNILEIISEQIILDLPVQPLCRTDCMGLCPKCGADFNKGECNCTEERHIDARLKKLKEFKIN